MEHPSEPAETLSADHHLSVGRWPSKRCLWQVHDVTMSMTLWYIFLRKLLPHADRYIVYSFKLDSMQIQSYSIHNIDASKTSTRARLLLCFWKHHHQRHMMKTILWRQPTRCLDYFAVANRTHPMQASRVGPSEPASFGAAVCARSTTCQRQGNQDPASSAVEQFYSVTCQQSLQSHTITI